MVFFLLPIVIINNYYPTLLKLKYTPYNESNFLGEYMKATIAVLALMALSTFSVAQAKEYSNEELYRMSPKVTYACPLPGNADFELRVMAKNAILSNGSTFRLALNEESEPFFRRTQL